MELCQAVVHSSSGYGWRCATRTSFQLVAQSQQPPGSGLTGEFGWSVLNGASFCAHSTCTTPLKPQRPLARSCPASRALHFLDHLRSKLTYRRDPRTSGIWSGKRPRHLSAFELASLPYCQSRRPRTIRQTVSLTGASSATFPRRMNIAVRPASVQSGASAASSTGCTNTYTGLPPVPAVP